MANPTHTKVVAATDHREATKNFLKLIAAVSRREGLRESEAFSRWLTFASCALANPVLAGTPLWQTNEDRYMAEVGRLRHPAESLADLARCLGITTVALEQSGADFLGPVFSELVASDGLGQFFTPWGVCRMMAEMTVDDGLVDSVTSGRRPYLRMQEPACGAGAMVLAMNAVLASRGLSIARQVHWVCVDVDWRAVAACHIQLTLTGASASVIHGNTLTLEQWDVRPTIMARMFQKRPRGPEEAAEDGDVGPVEAPAAATARIAVEALPGAQLDLFSM